MSYNCALIVSRFLQILNQTRLPFPRALLQSSCKSPLYPFKPLPPSNSCFTQWVVALTDRQPYWALTSEPCLSSNSKCSCTPNIHHTLVLICKRPPTELELKLELQVIQQLYLLYEFLVQILVLFSIQNNLWTFLHWHIRSTLIFQYTWIVS